MMSQYFSLLIIPLILTRSMTLVTSAPNYGRASTVFYRWLSTLTLGPLSYPLLQIVDNLNQQFKMFHSELNF